MNTRTLTAVLLTAGAIGAVAFTAQADSDEKLPAADLERVAAIVGDAGYTFAEAEIEDGKIEAEATKDGVEWELVIDLEANAILSAEQDD